MAKNDFIRKRNDRDQAFFDAGERFAGINASRGRTFLSGKWRGLRLINRQLCFGIPTRAEQIENKKIHPTQKPVALYAWIFQHFAKPGDKILDTHLGSGSSRIAAYDAGLDFVGFEIEKEYFDREEERFLAYTAQMRMEGI